MHKDAMTQLIQGVVGQLEVAVDLPKQADFSGVAIICHPHSLHGGSMQNKVVTTLMRTFRDLGVVSVRFNFRGVGKSEGDYAEGIGETDDLFAIAAWVKQQWPGKTLYLAGFSFGSFVAYRAAHQLQLKQLILVAPPVHHFNFAKVTPPTCPWLVVQGEQDEVVPPEEVFSWIAQLADKPRVLRFATGHFFHGHLIELKEQLHDVIITA